MSGGLHGHWSLGQVVTLLQHEFPEVTISKIRFMESQGLISPERDQSGYRHFYQGDYERLHWILVQQRDSYLPLRVIRDRLNSGERLPAVVAPDVVFEEYTYGEDELELNLNDPEPQLERQPAAQQQEPQQQQQQQQQQSQQTRQPQQVVVKPEPWVQAHPNPAPQQALRPRPRPQNERIDWASELDDSAVNDRAPANEAPTQEPEVVKPSDVSKGPVSAAQPLYTRLTPVEGTQASLGLDIPEPAPPEPQTPRLPGMNVSMRADELARTAGVDPAFISELTRYGIISPSAETGSSQFSNDTTEIVRLASEFAQYGLEPRHMRTVLLSAEREVELYTQTVGAGLRAGNAESRRQAHRNLSELASKAASMRAVMIKRMLRALAP